MLQVSSLALAGLCVQKPCTFPLCREKGALGVCEQLPGNPMHGAVGSGGGKSPGETGGRAAWMQQDNTHRRVGTHKGIGAHGSGCLTSTVPSRGEHPSTACWPGSPGFPTPCCMLPVCIKRREGLQLHLQTS